MGSCILVSAGWCLLVCRIFAKVYLCLYTYYKMRHSQLKIDFLNDELTGTLLVTSDVDAVRSGNTRKLHEIESLVR